MPYNKVMKTFKHKREKSIVKKYKLDRIKMLDTSKLKIGSVCTIFNLKCRGMGYKFDTRGLFETLFLEGRIKDEDIIDSSKYFSVDHFCGIISNGSLCTKIESSHKLISSDLPSEKNRYIEKKKAIKLAYKLKNRK